MPNPLDYTVGWICALSTEAVAAAECLDEEHGRLDHVAPGDNNTYIVGNVCGHNVVIAVLPDGEYGVTSAANVANDMRHSFRNIRICLMVGIGGGAPNAQHDLRLGDVVVSSSRGNKHGGVFQFDFGMEVQDQKFQAKGVLNRPPFVLRTAVAKLKVDHERKGNQIDEEIQRILCKNTRLQKKYKRPDVSSDRLYKSHIIHPLREATCKTCGDDSGSLVRRAEREEGDDSPVIHYGLIASSNSLMQNADIRDKLSEEEGVLCFEMEAAGLMNTFPCLVIRGICDYSDTHANKNWQGYAAMTAAAYAKSLLSVMIPNMVQQEKKISEVLGKINDNITAIQHQVNEAFGIQQADEDEKVMHWLTPLEFGSQHSDFLEKWQSGTCKWFLESEQYLTWLSKDKQQTLFCPGIPGAGKTILTSIVIENIKQQFRNDPKVGVAYIYCDFRRQSEQTVGQLIASLVKQLVQGLSYLPQLVSSLYTDHGKGKTRPSLDEFTRALKSVAATYDRIFVAIDALDECQTDGNCQSQFLAAIFSLQAKTENVSIFVTSRWIPEIEERFKGYPTQTIRASREDVSQYLEEKMNDFPTCVKGNLDLQRDIKTRVIECVEGIDIREDLEKLPSGQQAYEIAYDNAMERIEGQGQNQQRLAKQALSWISHARRQLTSVELQHALASRSGDSELIEDGITNIQDLVSWCIGLVTVDGGSGIIRLVHYTTQQYFDQTKARWFPNAEKEITTACLTYLSFNAFKTGACEIDATFDERLQAYSFYKYAACNWGYHGQRAMATMEDAISFLSSEKRLEASVQALMVHRKHNLDVYPASHHYSQRFPRQMTAIHLAAFFGAEELAKLVLQRTVNIDEMNSLYRTSLSLAAEEGHEGVVKLLLETGEVNVNSKNPQGMTPLSFAAQNGHQGVVKLLLDTSNVDADSKDVFNRTPLLFAAGNGYEGIVELFLDTFTVAIDPKDCIGRTPLFVAARNGHHGIVKLLLDTDNADVNSQDSDGLTPLFCATFFRHESVAKLLLSRINDDVISEEQI